MPDYADIPGLSKLQSLTLGDPRITIAILDGRADLERACFQGANLTQIEPDWQETNRPISIEEFERYFAIVNGKDGRSDDEKKEQLIAEFANDRNLLNRINFACHATHITSIILGQPGSPIMGVAPRCTGVTIPMSHSGSEADFIAPLNLSYAFNRALAEGATIIHCAACHPTRTGAVDELLERTIRRGQEHNVLFVAPGGNDYGDCWCIPAAIPGVLAVGAMRDDGTPFKFSNWGGPYQFQGILAPGEKIWGAQPTSDSPVRHNGTSCAAPIVTGVAALLMSLQLQQGRPLDPEAVQAALLNSTIPCDPEDVPESERCLRGKLNIEGAWSLLFDQPSLTISFSGDRITRSETRPAHTRTPEQAPKQAPEQAQNLSQDFNHDQIVALSPSPKLLHDLSISDDGMIARLSPDISMKAESSKPEGINSEGIGPEPIVETAPDLVLEDAPDNLSGLVLGNVSEMVSDLGNWVSEIPSDTVLETTPAIATEANFSTSLDSTDSTLNPPSNNSSKLSAQSVIQIATQSVSISPTPAISTPVSELVDSIAVSPSRPAPEVKAVEQFYDDIGQQLGKKGRTYEGCFLLNADPNIPLDRATNLFVAAQAGIQPGDYILDAACGAGGPSIDIAQQYPTVRIEGINLSAVQVDVAQTLIREADLEERVHVQMGDYHHLPYSDEVFDVVMCLEASGFTYDRPKLLAEFFRVLRPGGTLYIKEWLFPERPLTPKEQAQMAESERDTLYTAAKPSEYERDLLQVGFEYIKIRDLSTVLGSTEDWDTPICCGDIKAQRPGLTLRPSVYGGAIAAHPMATTVTDLTYRSAITPSATPISFVYALGTLGYDFGTEARRDSFKQLMPEIVFDTSHVPANPYDARQMVRYLDDHLSEAQALIWTLNLEQTPLYALLPAGPFAREVYAHLHLLLSGHIAPPGSDDYVEHVSIPGFLTHYTIRLFSGQVIPVVEVHHLRGLYGWHVHELVDEAVTAIQAINDEIDATALQIALAGFLNRVYFDLRNLGKVSRDRALNFAVTNAFQAASTFAEAIGQGMQLNNIGVEKSPFCRRNSDCWDVKLKFFDPENSDRAQKVYRFTIDVSDIVPVTLGSVRSWSVSK